MRLWRVANEKNFKIKWKYNATAEDYDKVDAAWVMNNDNEVLLFGEDQVKFRDVLNPAAEQVINSKTGLKIRNVQVSPDRSVIMIQAINNGIEVWSSGSKPQVKKEAAPIATKEETGIEVENTFEVVYQKFKTEIDKELNLRSDLFGPKGEFERTVEYEARLEEAENYKESVFFYYQGVMNREAEVEKELELTRQRLLAEKAKQDSERRAGLYRDKIKSSYSEFITKIDVLGTYNADTENFPITIGAQTLQIKVPFEKAREFKQNHAFFKVVGAKQLKEDAVTWDNFNYKIVTDKKEVYEFGMQKEPLFVQSEKDQLFNSIVADRGFKTAAAAAVAPAVLESPKSEDEMIADYFRNKRNHALFIGVNEYMDPNIAQLDGPIRDAERLMNVLKDEYAFDEENITFLKNPTRTKIIDTFDELQNKVSADDNLIIFYAGHGTWDEELKQGFWLPADARESSKAAWLSNAMIRDYIGGIKTQHTLLVADACFSGGIFKTRSAFNTKMASLELAKLRSRQAITSGAMKTVPDKSVFIEYFIKRLEENENELLPAEMLFSSFKIAVMNNSQGQVPQFGDIQGAGDEGGDFIFIRR